MRTIKKIIIHCTATEEGKAFDVDDIRRWHTIGNGWKDIGYHYLIGINGECWGGRKEEVIGAHCKGHNADSIGVCYVGGLKGGKSEDTRTQKQKQTMLFLLKELIERYPHAKIYGHRDFDKGKQCPCFDAKKEYSNIY